MELLRTHKKLLYSHFVYLISLPPLYSQAFDGGGGSALVSFFFFFWIL